MPLEIMIHDYQTNDMIGNNPIALVLNFINDSNPRKVAIRIPTIRALKLNITARFGFGFVVFDTDE